MSEHQKATRRRGKALEESILSAAWEELSKIGYSHLTMESVATRAGTNKAVLYRRWANKTELVIAALKRFSPKITDTIPNTGNLRDDVYTYLCACTEPLKTIGIQTIRGLMMEPQVWHKIVKAIPQISKLGSENKLVAAMTSILENAELRGEICLKSLTPRIVSLPVDLLLFELIVKQKSVSDTTIAEIVDDIFIPLIRASQSMK